MSWSRRLEKAGYANKFRSLRPFLRIKQPVFISLRAKCGDPFYEMDGRKRVYKQASLN